MVTVTVKVSYNQVAVWDIDGLRTSDFTSFLIVFQVISGHWADDNKRPCAM